MAEQINLDSLSNVVQRLTEGYIRYEQDTSDTQIRSANEQGLLSEKR